MKKVLVSLVKWLVLVPLSVATIAIVGVFTGIMVYLGGNAVISICQSPPQSIDAWGWGFSLSLALLLLAGASYGISTFCEFAPRMAVNLESL